MQSQRFDLLTASFAASRTRRGLLHSTAIIAFAAFAGAGGSAPVTAKRRGARHRVRPEVVGGVPAAQGELPFMAFLETTTELGIGGCGGTIVAPRFVLTAAHCTQTPGGPVLPPSAYWIGIGQVDEGRFTSENAFGVVAVTQHPNWNPQPHDGIFTNLDYDVAILQLDRSVPAALGSPLAFVGAGDTRFEHAGQPIVVSGWGLTSDNGMPSTRLLRVDIAVTSDEVCQQSHGDFINPEIVFCAGEAGRSSCQGDSGGPIFVEELVGYRTKKKRKGKKIRIPVYQRTQVGVTSFSGLVCDEGPNGFVRLSAPVINNFITGVIGS